MSGIAAIAPQQTTLVSPTRDRTVADLAAEVQRLKIRR